jgi:hypothetical protein
MDRYKLIILLFLFITTPSHAGMMMMTGDGTSTAGFCSAGCTGTTLFCWTGTSVTPDCTQGDNEATLVGEASTGAGGITLADTSDNGNDYYSFATDAFDIFPAGAFTLEMRINLSVIGTNTQLLYIILPNGVGGNAVTIRIDAGKDILVTHIGAGTTEANTFNANLNTSTQYDLVITADTATGMDVSIDGGANWLGVPASSTITTMDGTGSSTGGVRIGNSLTANAEGTITNIRIKSGYKTGY